MPVSATPVANFVGHWFVPGSIIIETTQTVVAVGTCLGLNCVVVVVVVVVLVREVVQRMAILAIFSTDSFVLLVCPGCKSFSSSDMSVFLEMRANLEYSKYFPTFHFLAPLPPLRIPLEGWIRYGYVIESTSVIINLLGIEISSVHLVPQTFQFAEPFIRRSRCVS